MKKRIIFLLVLLTVGMLLISACDGQKGVGEDKDTSPQKSSEAAEEKDANKGTIEIGMNNWAENVAASNMWKILLEEKGYDVELVNVTKTLLYSGVAENDLDIGMEVWIPHTDQHLVDEFKEDIEVQKPWYEGTGLGLVVPSYVDVDSITELKENKELFDGEIIGIGSGSSLMKMTDQALEDYGLDYDLVDSSGPVMAAALADAIKNKEPIVVTLWNPHWTFASFDLKYLDDPKKVYGEGDDIVFITRKGFGEDYPEVLEWMNNWLMTDATLGDLMATINEVDDPVKGASQWIEENRDLINEWISD